MLSGVYRVTSKSPLSIICDAGPLIHLDELNVTSLLNDFQIQDNRCILVDWAFYHTVCNISILIRLGNSWVENIVQFLIILSVKLLLNLQQVLLIVKEKRVTPL